MDKDSFTEQCFELLKKIPRGKVTTYKQIAEALGTRAYRAVGTAMSKNPYDTNEYPCHRVVNSNGDLGGYFHNIQVKIDKLEVEGVEVENGKIKDFKNKLFEF